MAEPHLSSPNGDRPVADSPRSLDQPARTLLRFRDEPIAGEAEADATRAAPATEPRLPSPNGARPAPDSLVSLEQRKERLAKTLYKKVEQGYEIESQTDTDAILVTKGRRRWFGILPGNPDTRQTTSIDERGRATTRTL
jgi:hypothetical protein